MLKEKLKNTCSFMAVLEDKDDTGYPRAELFYVRAYHDGSHWWNTVFHIHKDLMVPALVEEVDAVYVAFQKAFPDVKAVRDYIDHHAERTDDPTEGSAYLEMEHGLYCLRMIARKGDYNLYLHVLSKAALKGGSPG